LNIRFVNIHYMNICPHINMGNESNYS